ncbi:hypothetical protein [Haladaptatus litoreus]|uniref:hypothetical protein n=1 Tax=Haladaptatus litoreus TaxID=553468 RepID=UPI0015898F1B|nr:hypothetical protein [Haladaptatus litoreus]
MITLPKGCASAPGRAGRGDYVASLANSAERSSADSRAAGPRDNGEAVSTER